MDILGYLKLKARGSKPPDAKDSVKTIHQITVLTVSILIVLISVLFILYKISFEQQKNQLTDIVKSHNELIKAVAKFDAEFSATDVPGGSFEATLSQIRRAHSHIKGLGETGEYALAKLENNHIKYLLGHRHLNKLSSPTIPLESNVEEPMRRALSGQSGTMVGLDYRGEIVLAAYEPVPILNLGIVAKIDLAEIRKPFINSALYGGLVAIFCISLGTVYFSKLGSTTLKEILEIESCLDKTQEFSNVMRAYMGLDGRWLKVPPKLCQLLGYTEQELLTGKIEDIIHPEDFPEFWNQCQMLVKGQIKSFDVEERHLKKNGKAFWVFLNCSIVEGRQGQPLQFLIYILDANDRKQLESEIQASNIKLDSLVKEKTRELENSKLQLEKSKAYLSGILHHMVEGVVTINDQGIILSINPEAEKIFGFTSQEICGKNISMLMPEPYAKEYDQYIKTYLENRKATIIGINREVEGLKKDGTQFPMELTVSEFYADGEVRFIGSLRDISKRKRLEVEAASEKELYKTLLLSLKTSSSGDSLGESLKYCIQHICQIADWEVGHAYLVSESKDTLISSKNWHLSQRDLFDEFVAVTEKKVFRKGEGLPGRVFESGESLWIENITKDSNFPRMKLMETVNIKGGYAIPIKVDDEVIAILEFFCQNARKPNDRIIELLENIAIQSGRIFERYKYERDLEKYRNHLEKLVEERSKNLKTTNEELERFIYTASHDLQEPLRKSIIYGDRLKIEFSDKLGEMGENFINRIQRASFRMKDLIEDLLGYSRLSYIPDKFEPVILDEVIKEVLDDLEIQIQSAGGGFDLGKLPIVEADKTLIRQVFQNIITNALKYSKPDISPMIKISSIATEKNSFQISFEDNGIGFDEKYKEQIFQPLKRLHSDSNVSGSGMGLFICQKIIDRHHGTITAKSRPGEGSTFIITLPQKQPKTSDQTIS